MKTVQQANKLRASSSPERTIPQAGDEAGDLREAIDGVSAALSTYGRKNPTAIAVAMFFVGFYVGWKIKPW